jgi:Ca2+-binding RTX toxin-like protein
LIGGGTSPSGGCGDGNDKITGEGIDIGYTAYGENGNDTLSLGASADFAYGGEGNDNIHGFDGNDTLEGGNGCDIIYGDAGDDLIYGDTLGATRGSNDTLYGGDGDDTIYGLLGNDTIDGGGGVDHLYGNEGNDVLKGGNGDDILAGGAGADNLTGGAGADTFQWQAGDLVLRACDTITDFKTGSDKLNIHDILQGYNGHLEEFARFVDQRGSTIFQVDIDGAAGAAKWQNIAILQGASFTAGTVKLTDIVV